MDELPNAGCPLTWQWTRTDPAAAATPADLPGTLAWRPAVVPGTVAGAIRASGNWDGGPLPLDDGEFWFRTEFPGTGRDTLRLDGLATIAEVWVNGERLLVSETMFLAHRLELATLPQNTLHICFRSLSRWLSAKRGRARWRPRMIQPPSLRFARTTLLGRMPGWCPVIHPVGPWRPIMVEAVLPGRPRLAALELRTEVEGNDGLARISLTFDQDTEAAVSLHVGDVAAPLDRTGARTRQGTLRLPDVGRWWPHTHGEPHLYPTRLRIGDDDVPLAPLGFRTLAIDTGADGKGFALRVNGQNVFCRGACWTTPDLLSLPGGRAGYLPLLTAARDAGMNMIRVPGTMVYETDAFFELCDALGLMVWQDVMLANFDYPMKDEGFRAALAAELAQFLARTQARASLGVLCGGSEVMQQAAMFGQPRAVWQDGPHTTLIPEIAARLRPDVPYVANSPCGGDWPFVANEGVTHYYGVGCYQLPLTDARRAGVRFTSECLGFANVPCARTVAEALPVSSTTDPRWKEGTPHDMGVAWDFEDIRDHYLREVFGVDPTALRYEDFERYLDASRAVGCAVMEGVFAEWRRVGSICAGGLVYQLSDIRPGAGWGVIDSLGRPKPAWHALRRAFRPRQLIITDEGLNGLHLHVLNESDRPLRAHLTLVCLRDGRTPIREAWREVEVAPRGAEMIAGSALLPEFFDMAYAYRFGPPFHSVTAVWLADADSGDLIADAYHFTRKQLPPREALGLQAELARDDEGWWLRLGTQALARYVHVEDENYRAEEDWFHLPPGLERRVRLIPFSDGAPAPEGEVRALNLAGAVSYRSSA
jgi:beta-mannosidase